MAQHALRRALTRAYKTLVLFRSVGGMHRAGMQAEGPFIDAQQTVAPFSTYAMGAH